jgi:hypothetical protein
MRPKLSKDLEVKNFEKNYWLKEELVEFCKQNNISTSGSKENVEKRIVRFLRHEPVEQPKKRARVGGKSETKVEISLNSLIPKNYRNDERHRRFFKNEIGERFKFNTPFMNWMKRNAGQTYAEAVKEWLKIEIENKSGKKRTIAKQFKYNQYTRDFFEHNPHLSRKDAIACWNYKKSLPGEHIYESEDLKILKK